MFNIIADQSTIQNPQIVYVPVPVTPEQYFAMQHAAPMPTPQAMPTQTNEPNVFPHIATILGNATKIIVDRHTHDKEKLVDHVTNLIGSVCSFVQLVTTKGPLSDARIHSLAEEFTEQWLALGC